jgi:hypothetical protein
MVAHLMKWFNRTAKETLSAAGFPDMLLAYHPEAIMNRALFRPAFPVHDLDAAKAVYVEGLGCGLGRVSAHA